VKILFLNLTAALGGAERLLLDLLASLRQTDPALSLHLALGEDGPLADLAREHGVQISILPLPRRLLELGDSTLSRLQRVLLMGRGLLAGWAVYRYVGQLRRLIDAVSPDIVHSNSLKMHLLSALAARPHTRLVWHLHDFVGSRAVMRRILHWLAPRAAGAAAVSHAVADEAAAHLGRLPVIVVANAIDTDRFCPGAMRGHWLDELAGLPPAPPEVVRVGLVATYARWKGHDVFLDAAARLARRRLALPVRCYVVGGPIYRTPGSQWSREELRQRAARLLTENRIGFVDFQADPVPVYRALDVVVHASTQPEPFGLAIAEAMACGRAVVVARAGGAAELFTDDHDAVGVRPGDADELAGVLASLVEDPLRRRWLGMNARTTAQRRFARARLGPEVLAAYRHFGERSSALVPA
jgi:glycosyltransferase involved in cell wall biosynthesis